MMQAADLRNGDDAAKEREFGLDTRRAPERVLTRRALDQPSNLGFDPWSSGFPARLPPPEQFEASPMPTDHRVRLDDEEGGAPIAPDSGQQRPEDSITLAQLRTLGLVLKYRELLP